MYCDLGFLQYCRIIDTRYFFKQKCVVCVIFKVLYYKLCIFWEEEEMELALINTGPALVAIACLR